MSQQNELDHRPTPVPLAWAAFPPGLRTFLIIWAGQLVSLLGTGMTRFALLIWAYQQTGAATTVALLGFFSFIPFILISPLAGIVVDRVDRRLVMIFLIWRLVLRRLAYCFSTPAVISPSGISMQRGY